MKQYKEQCEALAKAGAIILVRDGFTEKGVPVYVTRKVTGCYGIKHGRNSIWGVEVDHLFADGANGVAYGMILGTNIDGDVRLSGLHYNVEIYGRLLTAEQKVMVLSDAEARLKMAGEDNERYNGRAKDIERFFRELNQRIFKTDWCSKNQGMPAERSLQPKTSRDDLFVQMVNDAYAIVLNLREQGKSEPQICNYLRSTGFLRKAIHIAVCRARSQCSPEIHVRKPAVRSYTVEIQINQQKT